jgi:Fe-S-cluster-containing dehydrogenase component
MSCRDREVEGFMRTRYLIIDVEKCENCQNCFLSCKDEHVENDWPGYTAPQPAQNHRWIDIKGKERGQFPLIDVAYLPHPCMHCDNAPCIKKGVGAVTKRPDGIVMIDPEKAKGKKELLRVCPYGAIAWNEELNLPQKCTLCAHLLDDGWSKTRCIQSCPTGALQLIEAGEGEMQRRIKEDKLETYRPEFNTQPRVYYKHLYRFTRCFIAGSVAIERENREECAQGARVNLSSKTGIMAQAVTDAFGDFKFDALEEKSGEYTLEIILEGCAPKTLKVNLEMSLNVGVIRL